MPGFPIAEQKMIELFSANKFYFDASPSIRQISEGIGILERELETEFSHFEIGNPGLNLPMEAKAVLQSINQQPVEDAAVNYSSFAGVPELKTTLSDHIDTFFGMQISPQNIIPTAGGMAAGDAVMYMMSNWHPEGSRIILLAPFFQLTMDQAMKYMWPGKHPILVNVVEHDAESLETELMRLTEAGDASAIVYNNPNNPLGVVFPESVLKAIANVCNRQKVYAVSDDVYAGLVYDKSYQHPFPHVGQFTDRFMMLLSASKEFSMAGLRIGALAFPESFAEMELPDGMKERYRQVDNMRTAVIKTTYSGEVHPVTLNQIAWARAMRNVIDRTREGSEEHYLAYARDKYGARMSNTKKMFSEAGFEILGYGNVSDATLYFCVRHPSYPSGAVLAKELMLHGIGVSPIASMGGPEEYVRVCISKGTPEMLETARQRLDVFDK